MLQMTFSCNGVRGKSLPGTFKTSASIQLCRTEWISIPYIAHASHAIWVQHYFHTFTKLHTLNMTSHITAQLQREKQHPLQKKASLL